MEQNIIISNLNDFIFCPRSIYFHNVYSSFDESHYYTTFQSEGRNAHKSIDTKKYSSRKSYLQGIDVFSETLGIYGKIDLFDKKNGILIERKNKIKKIYEGYLLQVYAQYFCLVEMGYKVKKIFFHSLLDNKRYEVKLPTEEDRKKLIKIISKMRSFSLEDDFSQNQNKCKMCIYRKLCDVYQDDD